MSPRVISYIRYSSAGQSLGDSEHRQLELADEYCREHGLTLAPDDVLRDLGMSAYRPRTEGAFAEFLEALRDGAIPRGTILIVEAWDRLWRDPPLRSVNQMTEIILAGIKIVTLRDKQEHDEESVNAQPHRLFHSLSLLISANAESALKAERVKKSYETRRKLAAEGKCLLPSTRKAWLDIKDGKFVPNEGSKTVRRIFEMVADGMGCYTVARKLQAEYLDPKIPYEQKPLPLSGGKKTKGWNKGRIQMLIQSDAPLGVLLTHTVGKDGKTRVKGERIEGYYPVIVEQTLADRARAQMKKRTFGGDGAGARGKLYTNLFSSIGKCGVCGSSMVLTNRNAKKLEWGWLRCSNAHNHQGCTNTVSIRYPDMEEQVLHDVAWFQKVRKQVPQHDPSQQLTEQIAEREGERKRIDDTLAAITKRFGETPLSAIADQMKAQAERRDVIDKELVELRQQHQQAMTKAVRPDLLTEKDKLLAQAASVDPQKRYEARARIATALRDTIATIKCMSDKTYEVQYPPIQLPEPYPEEKADQGTAFADVREGYMPRIREDAPRVPKMSVINAQDVEIIAERFLPEGTDLSPRFVTFRTVYALDSQRSGRVVRRYMDSSRRRMTFDLTDVDPNAKIPGID